MNHYEITLGVEEELQVVDAATGALAAHDFETSAGRYPVSAGAIEYELSACTLEVKTGICGSPDQVLAEMRHLRQTARHRARSQGQEVVSAGLHPFSDWRTQSFNDDPLRFTHYARVLEDYQDLSRGAMSFGLHIHLGLPDRTLRMPVMNRLRELLPLLMALSANSPFYLGRDTGLDSWRPALFGRLPRTGIPEAWDSEDAYFAHIDLLRKVGSIEPTAGLWEDIRLHHRYGTLEVRVCDAHHRLSRLWLLVAMLQVEAATLIDEIAHDRARPQVPRACIDENKWRARRYGYEARLVDWTTAEMLDVPHALERWLARTAPAARVLGLHERLAEGLAQALAEGTGASEQRRWLTRGGSQAALVGALVEATSEFGALA